MREFRLRESEMDAKREEKLRVLRQALDDRDESNEFLVRLSRVLGVVRGCVGAFECTGRAQ